MILNFCTLFDYNYFTRGLALYNSLLKKCPEFHLFIFPFDDRSFQLLKEINLKNVTLIQLKEFENIELLNVKKTRTPAEYYWTCTSSTIEYCLRNFDLDHCIYIDADIYFFDSPMLLVEEIPEQKSVLITEHRYTKEYDQTTIHGKFCVQFMYFRNEERSLRVLDKWRKQCIEWCFNRKEEGKFGDQKYLDDWETEFDCVHVLKNLGGGVAPWNVQQYNFKKNDKIVGTEKLKGIKFDLIFYHFHGYKLFKNNIFYLNHGYEISNNVRRIIYHEYTTKLIDIQKTKIVKESDLLKETLSESPVSIPVKAADKLKIYKNEIRLLLKHKNISKFNNNISSRIRPKNYVKYFE